jgi:hypothetical protein
MTTISEIAPDLFRPSIYVPDVDMQFNHFLPSLADLNPETLALMQGSSYIGKSDKLLTDLAGVIKESFEGP